MFYKEVKYMLNICYIYFIFINVYRKRNVYIYICIFFFKKTTTKKFLPFLINFQ